VIRKTIIWSFSGTPVFVYTMYDRITEGSKIANFSPALELNTRYTNKAEGTYKHHMFITCENKLSIHLDLAIMGVLDYI